jgi:hypothetical protein
MLRRHVLPSSSTTSIEQLLTLPSLRRRTTRPHLSWMASNYADHIAEALGLHRGLSEIRNSCEMFGNVPSPGDGPATQGFLGSNGPR